MAAPESRGSNKVLEQLFGNASMSREQLASVLEQAAGTNLKLERWWWKGQPAPDWFKAVARVRPDDIAATLTQLINSHSDVNQLSLEVFPKGTPKLEAVDVHITIDRNLRG